MPTGVPRLELWSDLEGNGGTREHVFAEVLEATSTRDLDGKNRLRMTVPQGAPAWADVQVEKVIRAVFEDGEVREWRIRKTTQTVKQDGNRIGEIEAEGILYDLGGNAEVITRTEADGSVFGKFGLNDRTPSQHVDTILAAAPSYFARGTIDPTSEVDLTYDWSTPLGALQNLADVTGTELVVSRRDSDGKYEVSLLTERGSSAEKVYLREAHNVVEISDETDSRPQATRVYPVGGGPDVAPARIAEAAWEVSSVSAGTIIFVDDPVGFDDQLNGLYLEKANGNLTEVTGSTAPDQVNVADASNISAGDELTFRLNAAGDDLVYLEDPVAKSSYGLISRVVRRSEIRPIQNLVDNPFLTDWGTDEPDRWDKIGRDTLPLAQDTSDQNTKHGGSAARVGDGTTKAKRGEGLETGIITVSPTASNPFYSATAYFRIVSGSIRMALVDVTNGEVLPDPDGSDVVTSDVQGSLTGFGMPSPDNFDDRGTTEIRLRIVAQEDGTEFYLDAGQVVNRADQVQDFFGGRAANELWRIGNDELEADSLPRDSFSVAVHDWQRVQPDEFSFSELVLGGTVQVVDDRLGLDFETRIVQIDRNLLRPAESDVEISSKPEDLVGMLGRPIRRGRVDQRDSTRPPVPADVDASTIQATFTDRVELDWNSAPNAEGYVLKWGTSSDDWSSASDLGETDTDGFLVTREQLLNEIASRQFTVFIKGKNGTRLSRNAASKQVSNPAPDASVIDPSVDVVTDVVEESIRLKVDLTGTEASRVSLHATGTSGFTVSDDNQVTREELDSGETVFTFQLEGAGFSIDSDVPGEDQVPSFDTYWKIRVWDLLTDPFGESKQVSSEFTVTLGERQGVSEPRHRGDFAIDPATGEITYQLEISDPKLRLASEPEYQLKTGPGDFDGTWKDAWDSETGVAGSDTFVDRSQTEPLPDKHIPALLWRYTWTDPDGNTQTERGVITGDQNEIAQVSAFKGYFDNGLVAHYDLFGDDDVDESRSTAMKVWWKKNGAPDTTTTPDNTHGSADNRGVSTGVNLDKGDVLHLVAVGVDSQGNEGPEETAKVSFDQLTSPVIDLFTVVDETAGTGGSCSTTDDGRKWTIEWEIAGFDSSRHSIYVEVWGDRVNAQGEERKQRKLADTQNADALVADGDEEVIELNHVFDSTAGATCSAAVLYPRLVIEDSNGNKVATRDGRHHRDPWYSCIDGQCVA